MKLLTGIIKAVLSLVLVLALVFVGIYIFARAKYGIDLWNTIGQLKTLSKEVNESEMCPNAIQDADYASMKVTINASVANLVSGDAEAGYKISFDNLPSSMSLISLTDNQVGAMAEVLIKDNTKVTIAGQEMEVALKQLTFDRNEETDVTTINTVVRLDITPLRNKLNKFPLKYLKKFVPQYLYISSTIDVTHGSDAFSYTLAHKSLTINKLNAEKTEDLFKTFDKALKIGDAEAVNKIIGEAVVGSLVGSETQTGFAYSLKSIGAKDYAFTGTGENTKFEVQTA